MKFDSNPVSSDHPATSELEPQASRLEGTSLERGNSNPPKDDPGSDSEADSPSTLVDDDEEFAEEYRAVSRAAVAAALLTFVSLLAFNAAFFVFLPLTSLVLALLARANIRRYPDEYVGMLPANFAVAGSLLILIGSVGVHAYEYATEVPPNYERITWRDLQPDDSNAYRMISDEAENLDGKKVFIKGYVYPNNEQTNLKAFVLVRDKGTCCFGGTPKATDMIYVKLEGKLRVNYSWNQRKLAGIFSIDDAADRNVGKLQQIGKYRLKADHLK